MLINNEVATATFSISSTVGCTLNFEENTYNHIECVVLILLVSILCRFCVDKVTDSQGHVENVNLKIDFIFYRIIIIVIYIYI